MLASSRDNAPIVDWNTRKVLLVFARTEPRCQPGSGRALHASRLCRLRVSNISGDCSGHVGRICALANLPLASQSASLWDFRSAGPWSGFAIQGLGTPAPPFPARHLVITGLYRHVRNPMYVAVTSLILGHGMLFSNVRLFVYGVFVWTAFHLFVMLYEEPTLRRTYGDEYEEFCANVRRWIPRLRPWKGPVKP